MPENRISSHLSLGQAALAEGRDAIALEHFVVAADTADSREERVAALGFAAEINLGLGRPYEAIAWAERLRVEAPRADQADLLEAVARVRLGDGQRALELLDRVHQPDTAHSSYRSSSVHLMRSEALRLVSRPQEALGELVAALQADPTDADVWRSLAELCQREDVDPAPAVAVVPHDRFAETVGQLVHAPAAGTDRILESLWAASPGDPRALVVTTYIGSQLPVERALVWSARMRAGGQARDCPLLGLAANREREAPERVRAAAVAWASFTDERAPGLLELATTTLPDEDLEYLLHQVAAIAPDLLDRFLVAGASTGPRALLLATLVLGLGSEETAVALMRHALTLDDGIEAVAALPVVQAQALSDAADRAGAADVADVLRRAAHDASARSSAATRFI
jgi:tetratricopeptide (TPR) repeat protein